MWGQRYRARGLTLIELAVTIVVASIAIAMAVPGFRNLAQSAQRNSATSGISTAILFARSEAVKRGINITVCPSSDGANCVAGDNPEWNPGWIVFEDADADNVVDAGEVILRRFQFDTPTFSVKGAGGLEKGIVFRRGGFPDTAGTLNYCDIHGNQSRSISINVVGRISVESSDGGCAS